MVRYHHQFNRCEFEQTPGDGGDRGAWRAAVHGVAKNQTGLNNSNEMKRRHKKEFQKVLTLFFKKKKSHNDDLFLCKESTYEHFNQQNAQTLKKK